jgi:hypothetical protein
MFPMLFVEVQTIHLKMNISIQRKMQSRDYEMKYNIRHHVMWDDMNYGFGVLMIFYWLRGMLLCEQ